MVALQSRHASEVTAGYAVPAFRGYLYLYNSGLISSGALIPLRGRIVPRQLKTLHSAEHPVSMLKQ